MRLLVSVLAISLSVAVPMAQQKLERPLEKRMQLQLADAEGPHDLQRMVATPCVGGLSGIYPCDSVDLLTFMPLSEIGGGTGNDIWGWTDPLDGREYAIMGRSNGTAFVDITDPVNPVYLGNLAGRGSPSDWRDIKVHANHAYIVSESFGHGMQVFDLTQLRNVVAPPAIFPETAHYDDFGSAHNIAINEATGYAYAVGTGTCAGGSHFIDLADPAAPVFAGCFIETIYTHDTQCVIYAGPDAEWQGREVCFNSNENKLNVVDVNDKANTALISSTTYAGVGYTHQGWLTEDHRYFLLGDELDEQNQGHPTRTRIFDVRDLDAPELISVYDGVTNAVDHNLYTLNGYAYQANYRAGLQIFDLADIASGAMTQIADFDIYPSSNSANFNGAWSVYPYFDSGTVIVSGIEQGLFILRPNLPPDFLASVDAEELAICDPGQAQATLDLTERNGYAGNANLVANGLPLGATAQFGADPLAAPGSTTVTIDTAGVAPGNYPFTLEASDGTTTRQLALELALADDLPGTAANATPLDAELDVARTPSLSWSAASQAFSYTVEIATDPDFNDVVFSAETTATTFLVDDALQPLSTYWWRVRATNACGEGLLSSPTSFTTLDIPPILVVDDDDNSPDVRADWTDLLTQLGEDFDVWDTENSDAEPNASTLAPYETVIWFTGDEFGGAAGPGGGGESALASWLDEIGCLLVASQDYFYDRGLTGFMQSHLGLDSATSDVGQSSATGAGTVFGALANYALSFPYTNYTDTLTPDGTAEAAFVGTSGDAAIDKDSGVYRTTFWSFGIEGIGAEGDRQAIMTAFLDWCDGLAAADADSDGTSNSDDCAPVDGDAWRSPSIVNDLRVEISTLNWSAPATLGATIVDYDLLRSGDPSDFGAGSCLESNDLDTTATDGDLPAPGTLFAYLVRVENLCGESLGNASDASSRGALNCP